MAPTADRRTRRRERIRGEILDAAWRLAERNGIAGVTLRELAGEVGMRAPSLYTYFDGKDAIYDAMFAQGYEQLWEQFEGLAEDVADTDRLSALTDVVERWLAFCQASLPRYQLMFTRAVPGWEPSPEAYAVSQDNYGRMVEILAGMGIRGRETLDLYTALVSGLAAQQLANDPGGDRWTRLAPDAMRMFLAHLNGEEPS